MLSKRAAAHALTALCPLRDDTSAGHSVAAALRDVLRQLPVNEQSPFAHVPNLYACRLFVLDDMSLHGEHLHAKYLVFAAELHIDLDVFLEDLWAHAHGAVLSIWQHCSGFERVTNAGELTDYLKKCQVRAACAIQPSRDSLAEQLKALYLRQELATFVREHQGRDAISLQRAFRELVRRIQPFQLTQPTWRAGASDVSTAATE